MKLIVLPPTDCPVGIIDAFLKLVESGGEVIGNSLRDRIKKSELLAFCQDGEHLVAVGALKNPARTYKENIFIKAGHPEECENFKYEFGYLYVEENYREKGVGKKILAALLEKTEMNEVFVTVREENTIMVSFLKKYGFKKLGHSYKSERGDYQLGCYVHEKKGDIADYS